MVLSQNTSNNKQLTEYTPKSRIGNLKTQILWASQGKAAQMKDRIRNFWRDTQGQDLVEYALAAGMVAVAAVGAMPALSTTVSNVFNKIGGIIENTVH